MMVVSVNKRLKTTHACIPCIKYNLEPDLFSILFNLLAFTPGKVFKATKKVVEHGCLCHINKYSPLHKYQNSEANSFIFAVFFL